MSKRTVYHLTKGDNSNNSVNARARGGRPPVSSKPTLSQTRTDASTAHTAMIAISRLECTQPVKQVRTRVNPLLSR